MKTPINDLTTKGFVIVQYPPQLRSAVEETVALWKKFCDLPSGVKESLGYSNNSDGVGYELKQGAGNKADRKENFDVSLAGKKWLENNARQTGNVTALQFIESASGLVSGMKPLIADFAGDIEKTFGVEGLAKEVDGSEDAYFIRFIHYFGDRTAGEEIAAAHVDQSAISLHLHESAEGFKVLAPQGRQWTDTPISTAQTVIIPSLQMQYRSEGKLTAICHRVVATDETAKIGRYSAVCFVQLTKTPKYDKDRCGRLQEKEPGFNYGMAQEEFAKLFKK